MSVYIVQNEMVQYDCEISQEDNIIDNTLLQTVRGAVKNDTIITTNIHLKTMDYSKKTRNELIAICKENNLKGYSSKKKLEIIALLSPIEK